MTPRVRTLAIGVTGHRPNQLPQGDLPRLIRTLEGTLEKTVAAAQDAADGGRIRPVLISALAEGTDRYAAHAALERGWKLVAPLPFKVARYLKDFEAPESRAEFEQLRAAAQAVEPEGKGSYLVVGEMILDRSDVLVALWNGSEPKGPGGTADVAARALKIGTPVVWISVERNPVRVIAPARAPRRGTFPARFHAALADAFKPLPQPPAMRLADA